MRDLRRNCYGRRAYNYEAVNFSMLAIRVQIVFDQRCEVFYEDTVFSIDNLARSWNFDTERLKAFGAIAFKFAVCIFVNCNRSWLMAENPP